MAETFQTISDKLDALETAVEQGFATIQAEIDSLKAGGQGATQEQLDALGAKVDSITQDILQKEGDVK